MKSEFYTAYLDVLEHEGGRVNHRADRGGSTAYGISLRFLKGLPDLAGDVNGDGHVSEADIDVLTRRDAQGFYLKYFWEHYDLGQIQDQVLATKMFNFFVNMRGKTAALIAQRAANDFNAGLLEDGVLGPASFAAINRLPPAHLLVCIKYHAWQVYKAIVSHRPSQAVFLNGWQNRAFS
ncbi:glycoside hydrolase family 108 protein [Pontibacterium sp.]|uniref:glycoside hydrolase family 108 protein n=1 Tax=Pontibacterium sp. TaxID=2036026 RepID=UPI0035680F34